MQDFIGKFFMADGEKKPTQNKPKKGATPPQKPDGEFDWGKVIKTVFSWGAVIIAAVIVMQYARAGSSSTTEITFSIYEEVLAGNKIYEIKIIKADVNDYRIEGVLKEKDVAKLIADETTLNAKEAEMALYQFQKVLLRAMLDGKTIQLGELGSFRLTINTEGVGSLEEVTTDLIKKVNLRFLPSVTVREALQKATFTPAEKISQ